MASTRKSSEKSAYLDQLKQSTDITSFTLDSNRYEHPYRCLSNKDPRHKNGGYLWKPEDLVNIDSILSNRVEPNTKSIGKLRDYYIDVKKLSEINHNTYFPRECDNYLVSSESRFTDPAQQYREKGFDVFYPLIRDPQCNIFWDTSINSRLYARDNILPKLPNPQSYDINKLTDKLGPRKWN